MQLFIFEHIYNAQIAAFTDDGELIFTQTSLISDLDDLKTAMIKIDVMPPVDLSGFYPQDIVAVWRLNLPPVSAEANPVKPTKKSK